MRGYEKLMSRPSTIPATTATIFPSVNDVRIEGVFSTVEGGDTSL